MLNFLKDSFKVFMVITNYECLNIFKLTGERKSSIEVNPETFKNFLNSTPLSLRI